MNSQVIQRIEDQLQKGLIVPDNLIVELGGPYLYICKVDDGCSFSNGDLGRLGLVFLIPDQNPTLNDGAKAKLFGIRLASTRDGKSFISLDIPSKWTWDGHISLLDNHLQIEYDLSDGLHMIQAMESVRPTTNDDDWTGSFHAVKSDKSEVTGTVRHIRWWPNMKMPNEFKRLTINFWDVLSPKDIGAWGRRLYNLLPDEEKATDKEPVVIIDLITMKHIRSTKNDQIQTLLDFKRENPSSVPYCIELNGPSSSMGFGVA